MVFPTHQPTLVLISGFFQIFEVKVCDKHPKINLVFIDDNSFKFFKFFSKKEQSEKLLGEIK
jgi:hypothetical protein